MSARIRTTPLSTALLTCAVIFLLHPAAHAQGNNETLKAMRKQAEAHQTQFAKEEKLSDMVLRNTLDKERIAAEAKANMKTLKEMGNPHIPSAFLLKQAQDDPNRQIDGRRKRKQRAQMLKTHGQSPTEAYRTLHGDQRTPASPEPESSSSDGTEHDWLVTTMLCALFGLLIVVLRRSL